MWADQSQQTGILKSIKQKHGKTIFFLKTKFSSKAMAIIPKSYGNILFTRVIAETSGCASITKNRFEGWNQASNLLD